MPEENDQSQLLGRGASEGARLFREWFAEVSDAKQAGRKTAYVFVMASLAELLRAFDFNVSFPEINALQAAIRRAELDYMVKAEDYGYSADICGYVRIDVGLQLRGGEHPMGCIPKPDLIIASNTCNTYLKWAEIWERMNAAPLFTLDLPGWRTVDALQMRSDASFEIDRRYVEAQLKELIGVCERVSGRKFDIDRLRKSLAETNRMSAAWRRILKLNSHVPAPFNALGDGTIYLGVANALRGDPRGTRYLEELSEELAYKAAQGIGTVTEEKHRLVYVGLPCYPIFRRFLEMFTKWGAVFVASTYLGAPSGGFHVDFEYDLDRPVESLAEGLLRTVIRGGVGEFFFIDRLIPQAVERLHADGVVFHAMKSCRTASTGLADARLAVTEAYGIPSLYIESDLVDRRVVSEAQLQGRIDAFFEALNARKLRSGAAPTAAL
jgi:benzoyl-CoA reductase subunit B